MGHSMLQALLRRLVVVLLPRVVVGIRSAGLSEARASLQQFADLPSEETMGEDDAPHAPVQFLVNTWHHNYGNLALAIRETWGKELGRRLIMIGDKPNATLGISVADKCEVGRGQHGSSHICKLFYGLVTAHRRMQRRGIPWLFVTDDDMYVLPRNVNERLRRLSRTLTGNRSYALGCIGCGEGENCRGMGGLCGGCGMALNLQALEDIIGAYSDDEFVNRGVSVAASSEASNQKNQWGDMAISCLLRNQKCTFYDLDGLYGWGLQSIEDYRTALLSTEMKPLAFHYMDDKWMYWMQNLLNASIEASGAASAMWLDRDAGQHEQTVALEYQRGLRSYLKERRAAI